MQFDDFFAGGGLERFIVVKAFFGLPVEGHQITQIDGISGVERFWGHLLEVGDQHAELGSPVTHVVEPQHLVAAEFQNAGQAVANDRGAQMPHMHFFGDVGAGEINNHRRFGLLNGRNAQAWIAASLAHLCGQHRGFQGDVDEPRPCDLWCLRQGGKLWVVVQLFNDGCGDLPRCLLERLGQGEGTVGLEITKFRLAGWAQGWIQLAVGLRKCLLHGCAQLGLQGLGNAQHEQGPQPR